MTTNSRAWDAGTAAFLRELAALCKKHGRSISHEDGHGAFIIEEFSRRNIEGLFCARGTKHRFDRYGYTVLPKDVERIVDGSDEAPRAANMRGAR